LLVFANKQDLINAAEVEEIVSVLDLKQIRVRPWHIQPCNAREGDGLAEGMEWLVTEVNAME
jgi:signal recognition particle receptor subunit beta